MYKQVLFGAAAAGALVLGACGQQADIATNEYAGSETQTAENTAPVYPETPAPAPVTDAATAEAQDFVNAATQANMASLEMSKIALQRAASDDVRAYAQTIVDDHEALSGALTTALVGTTIEAPAVALNEANQNRLDDLTQEAQGDAADATEWDHDYMTTQIDMQQNAVDLFEDYAENGNVATLKMFAESNLPTLKDNLAKAKAIEGMVDDDNPLTPD